MSIPGNPSTRTASGERGRNALRRLSLNTSDCSPSVLLLLACQNFRVAAKIARKEKKKNVGGVRAEGWLLLKHPRGNPRGGTRITRVTDINRLRANPHPTSILQKGVARHGQRANDFNKLLYYDLIGQRANGFYCAMIGQRAHDSNILYYDLIGQRARDAGKRPKSTRGPSHRGFGLALALSGGRRLAARLGFLGGRGGCGRDGGLAGSREPVGRPPNRQQPQHKNQGETIDHDERVLGGKKTKKKKKEDKKREGGGKSCKTGWL